MTFGAALLLFLAGLWCWSVAAPAWGVPVGAGLLVVAMCLLAHGDKRETSDG